MFPFSQNCEINVLNRSILGYIIFVQQFFFGFFFKCNLLDQAEAGHGEAEAGPGDGKAEAEN